MKKIKIDRDQMLDLVSVEYELDDMIRIMRMYNYEIDDLEKAYQTFDKYNILTWEQKDEYLDYINNIWSLQWEDYLKDILTDLIPTYYNFEYYLNPDDNYIYIGVSHDLKYQSKEYWEFWDDMEKIKKLKQYQEIYNDDFGKINYEN